MQADEFWHKWWTCTLRPQTLGFFTLQNGSQRPWTRRDPWILLLVLEGHVQINHPSRTLDLPSDTACLLPPNACFLEEAELSYGDSQIEILSIDFLIQPLTPGRNPLLDLGFPLALPNPHRPDLIQALRSLAETEGQTVLQHMPTRLRLRGILDILLTNLIETGFTHNAFTHSPDQPTWVLQALETINKKCYRQDIRLRDLAKQLDLHPDYIGKVLKKHLGCSLPIWIREQRCLLAQQLLVNQPDLAVGDVAKRCGYQDVSRFSREFRTHTACSPSQFRRKKE